MKMRSTTLLFAKSRHVRVRTQGTVALQPFPMAAHCKPAVSHCIFWESENMHCISRSQSLQIHKKLLRIYKSESWHCISAPQSLQINKKLRLPIVAVSRKGEGAEIYSLL